MRTAIIAKHPLSSKNRCRGPQANRTKRPLLNVWAALRIACRKAGFELGGEMVFNLHCYRHVVQRSAYLAWGICRKEDVSEPQAVQLNSISQKAHLLGKITSTPDDQHVLALSPPTSTPSYQPTSPQQPNLLQSEGQTVDYIQRSVNRRCRLCQVLLN